MSDVIPDRLRSALGVPFAHGPDRLGRSLWLYLLLVLTANHHGLVVKHRRSLAESLGVEDTTVDEWLERLKRSRLVEVKSPCPFLVISFPSWSGEASRSANDSLPRSGLSQIYVPVGRKENRDGGRGEGEELHSLAVRILGEAARPQLETLLGAYPEAMIRRALARVEATPTIRHSKLALFRYLLDRFTRTPHAH